MADRIIRGVRVATTSGIEPAAVYIEAGRVVAVTGYEDVPRVGAIEELSKSLLMPALASAVPSEVSRVLAKAWTRMREQDIRLETLIAELCTVPAVQEGMAADLLIWNPEYAITGTSPPLYGVVREVMVGGCAVV